MDKVSESWNYYDGKWKIESYRPFENYGIDRIHVDSWEIDCSVSKKFLKFIISFFF